MRTPILLFFILVFLIIFTSTRIADIKSYSSFLESNRWYFELHEDKYPHQLDYLDNKQTYINIATAVLILLSAVLIADITYLWVFKVDKMVKAQ
jgi:low affinity Fe/Cu permease